jgi:EAL domain-containing protein (putative c-di-GMP-specific phosphodiesterase class I)
VEKWADRKDGGLLFLNLKPSWIYRLWKEQGYLYTLSLLDRHGVEPENIVIEITEEEFGGNLYELAEIVEQYRLRGCKIAIDDVGSGFSNFDRIAVIRPKILKLDLESAANAICLSTFPSDAKPHTRLRPPCFAQSGRCFVQCIIQPPSTLTV